MSIIENTHDPYSSHMINHGASHSVSQGMKGYFYKLLEANPVHGIHITIGEQMIPIRGPQDVDKALHLYINSPREVQRAWGENANAGRMDVGEHELGDDAGS